MTEPFDVYTDAFIVTVTPWGANVSISLREPHPAPVSAESPDRLGTIRMSNEHLKVLVFMCKRQILDYESNMQIQVAVPTAILSQLGIAMEDWDAFWAGVG